MAISQVIQELEAEGGIESSRGSKLSSLKHIDVGRAGKLLNRIRVRQGLSPVVQDERLVALAQDHASMMAERGRVTNSFGPGTSLRSRLAAAGLRGVGAECVGAGHSTADSLFQDWAQSRGHHKIMTSDGMTSYGFAAAANPRSRYRTYWTLILLRPSSNAADDTGAVSNQG